MTEYKKGDRFLVEVWLNEFGSSTGTYIGLTFNNGEKCVFKKDILDSAQKIEPEYEDGEWYWCKWTDAKGERCSPWLYQDGRFEKRNLAEAPRNMHHIGPKAERPDND